MSSLTHQETLQITTLGIISFPLILLLVLISSLFSPQQPVLK
jgi:hypothetical protein